MRNKKSIGLPSGPNEFLKDITQHISVEGYKRYSEDVNNPYNIIESSNITMEDVDFPVRGYGNNGIVQDMEPGENYNYGNADYVVEMPMAQDGTETKKVEEKSIWGLVKEMAAIPGANISNLLGVMGIPANLIAEATESLTGRGDGEFNFMDAMPSRATPGSDDEIFTFTNQNGTPVKNVAELEDAEGNPLVENPVGAFITNLATDPSTYVGAGVVKNAVKNVTQKGLKRGLRKTIAKNIPRKVKTPIEGTDMIMTTNSKIGQAFDKTGIPKLLGWKNGFNYGPNESGRSFVASAQNAGDDIIDLSKYTDDAGDYFSFDNAFVANPMKAGRSMKAMENAIPKYGVIKQNPLSGSLSEDSFTMMLQRLKDSKKFKDVTNYGESIFLNRSGKNRIVKPGPTNQMLVNKNLFDASEVAALNTKYGKVFDKLKNKGVLNDDFLGFGTREIKIPGLADKVYQVGVPNIGVQKLYQVGGEYKVQKGDTFYGIANRNNVSWDTLQKANPNVNIESLGLNQTIIIPKEINPSPVIAETTEVISENKPFEFNKDLLLKQTFAESSFKPGAKSNVGAQGLTQFMPDTITEIKRLNLVGSDFDIHDPVQAVQAHKLYMDHLYNKDWVNKENQSEEVRLAKTLAAYNRGPNAVRRILTKEKRKGKDIYNSLDWLDALPNQTRDYINMILLGKNSKGRPNFQDNFIKVLNDDNYKQYIDLYQYGGEGPMLPTMADYPLVNEEEEFIGPYTDDYIPKKEEYGYNPNRQKPVVNNNSYVVKSGDNLSRIANKYKTSVDELIRLNDISDPNKISINQELILPEIPENSAVDNLYKVKSGDTLGKIAKAYKTSVNKLATLNNIEDVNKININQELVIPDSYKEKPFIEESWHDIDDIQKNNDRVNNLTDENIIINSQLLNAPNQSYVVIDKKTQRLKLYRGDEIGLDFEVLTGKNPGDAQTVTNVIDQNGDGIITDADKINGNFKTDWTKGNLSTGAGIYTINQSSQTSEDRYQNAPSFNLLNESGIQVGTSIHGTPTYRNSFFDDGNLENNNASYGCINGKCSDLDALYDMNLPAGTPVYILPEDEGNAFQQVDGKAVMRMDSKNRENYLQYTDVMGNEQEGQGGNYSTSTLKYKPIRAKLDEKLFKEKVYTTFDFNDDEEFNNITQPFISALEKNKKNIMMAAQIPGDVYNQIARMAFGVYGTESNFGDTHSAVGNVGRAATKYFDSEGSSSPDVVSKYDTYGIQGNNNSVGYTQIRFQHTPWVDGKVLKYDENGKATYNGKIYTGQANKPVTVNELNLAEKTALEAVGITSNKDFLDPEKAAIGTAVVLGVRYNQELTTKQKKDIWKYLPSKWNNRPNYGSRVKSNSRYLKFVQKDRLQKGGEVENNIMYKNYIDGVYTGSKMESKAEKVYDKLNRLYYRDAKAKQMTPANYVLSHIIG